MVAIYLLVMLIIGKYMAAKFGGIPLNKKGKANLALALAMVLEKEKPGFATALVQIMHESAEANTTGFECCVCSAWVPPHCGTCCPDCGTW